MRVNAMRHHAACRTSHPGRDAGVSRRQQQSQLRSAPAASRFMAFSRVPCASKSTWSCRKRTKESCAAIWSRSADSAKRKSPVIARWRERGVIEPRASRRHPLPTPLYARRYPAAGRADAAHEGLWLRPCAASSSANSRSIARPNTNDWPRSAASHIYNFRRTRAYREHHVHHTKTLCASAVSIGERRKPDPRGSAWLRAGRHRAPGRQPVGQAGIYHINAVDTLTQWQVVGCCETISEAHLLPVLDGDTASIPLPYPGLATFRLTARSFSTTRCRNC